MPGPVPSVGPIAPSIARGAFVPGARGLKGGAHVVGLPGGVAPMTSFLPQTQRREATAPMDRPVMIEIRKRVAAWLNSYFLQVRGKGLQEGETLPPLLLLIFAMQHAKHRAETYDALECMKAMTFPIASSVPVTVKWEHQPFTAVPYEVRHFPLGVATLILEAVRTTVFDDQNVHWHERKEGYVMRMLQPSERPVLAYLPFREPTPEEQAAMAGDYGAGAQSTISMTAGESLSGGLLINMNPGAKAATVDAMPQNPPPPASGGTSMPVTQRSDPNVPPVFQNPGTVDPTPAATGGQVHAPPSFNAAPQPTPTPNFGGPPRAAGT